MDSTDALSCCCYREWQLNKSDKGQKGYT